MIGRCIALAALIGSAALAASGQDWAEAAGYFQRFSGSKDPGERAQAAAKLEGGMDGKHDKQAVGMLLGLLTSECNRSSQGKKEEDVSGEVLLNCETSLKKATTDDARELVITQAKKNPDARLRFHLARVLGAYGGDKVLATLREILAKDRDPKPLIGACDALLEMADPATLTDLIDALKSKTMPWEGKLSALQAVEKINDPDKSVDGLIEALIVMPEDLGRLKVDLIALLGKFCDVKDPKSDDPNWWRTAWADKKGGKTPGQDGGTVSEPTEFFGLKSKSTRIVFVLDRTGSMEEPCTFPSKSDPKKPPTQPEMASGGQKPSPQEEAARLKAAEIKKKWDDRTVSKKIEGLKREFINTIYSLDKRVHFGVVYYESAPQPWKQELVPATWQNKLECIQEIEKLSPSGPTNIWSGLETAYKMVEQPNRPDVVQIDKKGNYATVVKGADTFFLMTDGNHNTGKFVDGNSTTGTDAKGFIAELKKVHALRKVVIHVIALGDLNAGPVGSALSQQSLNFLQQIADATGGTFAHIGKK